MPPLSEPRFSGQECGLCPLPAPRMRVLKVAAVPSSQLGPCILVLQPRARRTRQISLSVDAQGSQICIRGRGNSECSAQRSALPLLHCRLSRTQRPWQALWTRTRVGPPHVRPAHHLFVRRPLLPPPCRLPARTSAPAAASRSWTGICSRSVRIDCCLCIGGRGL